MLSHQKNSLLSLLLQFKVKLLEKLLEYDEITINDITNSQSMEMERVKLIWDIIDRNITSIEKQIKKL